jgi:hypothetical protein
MESYTPGKRVVAVSPAKPVKAVSTDEAALNSKINELEETIAAKDSELAKAKQSSADNSYEVTKLKAELRTIQGSKATTAGIPGGWLAIPKKTPSSKNARSVLTNATKHEAGIGDWKITPVSLTQSDTSQKFAKYLRRCPSTITKSGTALKQTPEEAAGSDMVSIFWLPAPKPQKATALVSLTLYGLPGTQKIKPKKVISSFTDLTMMFT